MEQLVQELNFTHWTWFIAMLVFLFLEMIVPGVAFLWLGIAAAIVGTLVLMIADISWEMQLVLFAILSTIAVIVGRRLIKQQGDIPSDNELLNQRGHALIGRQVVVEVAITNGKGKVKVGDSLWTALGSDKAKGETVIIVDVQGNELLVK